MFQVTLKAVEHGLEAQMKGVKEYGNGLMDHLGAMKTGGNLLNQIIFLAMKIAPLFGGERESGLM